MSLNQEEQAALLRIARAAIEKVIMGPGALFEIQPEKGLPDPFSALRSGAFVSIHNGQDLRGCVGYPESDLPLLEVVRHCAISAATSDSRFPTLKPAEFPQVTIEISVLAPIEPVADLSEIDVGRHGLIVRFGRHTGLLLPQVATEHEWEREEFARHTCRKAGLPDDAWRTGAQLFKFEAQVFAEASQ